MTGVQTCALPIFTLGPAIGGILGAYDLRAPFWAAAALSLANAAYGFFVLPESLPPEKRTQKFVWRSANVAGGFELLKRTKLLACLGAASFLFAIAHESLPGIFVLYTDHRYHWDATTVGLALAFVGVAQTIVSGGLVRPMVKRFGEWPMLVTGLVCGAMSFVVYAFAPTTAAFLLGIPFGALWGFYGPAQQALMSREVSSQEQGQIGRAHV